MRRKLSAVRARSGVGALLGFLLPLADGEKLAAQAINETPGINKNNHTAYVFGPYRWANGGRNEPSQWVLQYVSDMALGEGMPIGQQYSYIEMQELKEPTKDNPAKICTVPNFRDLLMKNQ